MNHSAACVCNGRGTIEDGPAGATYSVPCPGPPDTIRQFGRIYLITPKGEAVAVVPVATLELISAENARLREALAELRQALHLVDQDLRCLPCDAPDVWISLRDAQAIVERAIYGE